MFWGQCASMSVAKGFLLNTRLPICTRVLIAMCVISLTLFDSVLDTDSIRLSGAASLVCSTNFLSQWSHHLSIIPNTYPSVPSHARLLIKTHASPMPGFPAAAPPRIPASRWGRQWGVLPHAMNITAKRASAGVQNTYTVHHATFYGWNFPTCEQQ